MEIEGPQPRRATPSPLAKLAGADLRGTFGAFGGDAGDGGRNGVVEGADVVDCGVQVEALRACGSLLLLRIGGRGGEESERGEEQDGKGSELLRSWHGLKLSQVVVGPGVGLPQKPGNATR